MAIIIQAYQVERDRFVGPTDKNDHQRSFKVHQRHAAVFNIV